MKNLIKILSLTLIFSAFSTEYVFSAKYKVNQTYQKGSCEIKITGWVEIDAWQRSITNFEVTVKLGDNCSGKDNYVYTQKTLNVKGKGLFTREYNVSKLTNTVIDAKNEKDREVFIKEILENEVKRAIEQTIKEHKKEFERVEKDTLQ